MLDAERERISRAGNEEVSICAECENEVGVSGKRRVRSGLVWLGRVKSGAGKASYRNTQSQISRCRSFYANSKEAQRRVRAS